jgi:hypothetical protein
MHGYDYPFVEPFIKSLKKTGYVGDLVIFTSDTTSKTTKKLLTRQGATLISFNPEYPFIEKYRDSFKNIIPSVTINNYRFILYLQFLIDNGGKYRRVMLTDIRDVIFQKEPFSMFPDGKICFFLEDPVHNFSHQSNYQWLSDATDIDTANQLISQTVSCAGITIGSASLIIDYLNYMKSKLSFRNELEWGLDQGIHNSYIYLIKPAGMHLFSNDEPFVSTLGAYQPYKENSNGEVVNSKEETYAIVHQYDRSGKLFMDVKQKYNGNRFVQKLKRAYFLLMP